MVDYERENRFNASRSVETCNAHPFVFQRFCKSIRFKYVLEMIICGTFAVLFQYFITLYIGKTNSFFNFGIEHYDVERVIEVLQKIRNNETVDFKNVGIG